MIVEYLMIVEHLSDQPTTGPSDLLQPSLIVKPKDLVPGIHQSLFKAKMGKVEVSDETLYPPFSRFVLKGLRAQSSFNGNVVEIVKYLPDQGRYRVSPVEALSVTPVTCDVRPHNLVPVSPEISTTREPRHTERRSLNQSGRKNSRRKLIAGPRSPEFLQSTSMPNVMERAGKQRSQRISLQNFQQPSMSNIVSVTPVRKPSQRRLHDVSDSKVLKRRSNNGRTSSARDITVSPRNQNSRRANNERASSARDATASPRNQKCRRGLVMEKKQTSERTLLRTSGRSSEAKCVDDARMLPKQHVKPSTNIRLQGFLEDDNCNRVKPDSAKGADAASTKAISSLAVHTRKVPTTAHATNGQTVTITKVLKDDKCNSVKPDRMEAADVTPAKAANSLPVHTWKVPTTAHATRHPVTPQNTSNQRFIVQNRKSDPRSCNVTLTPYRMLPSKVDRPSYQTAKSESVLIGLPFCPFPSSAATKKRSSTKEKESLHSDSSGCTWDCESFATDETLPITNVFQVLGE
jgi:hypothetical protein